MATYTKNTLSGGSANGKAIKVTGTGTSSATLLHTGSTTTTTFHEIWLYAVNTSATASKLTIEWGGTTNPDDHIELTVQPEAGLVTIAPGLLIKGASTALLVKAFADTANVITIHGFVNEITAS